LTLAFLAAAAFLDLNGYLIEPSEEDMVERMISVAKGALKQTGLSRWLKSRVQKKSRT
jgi:prophage maintenance system killer protein